MGEILESLKSPSWWFTAFFVGLIASLVAGYIKDLLPIVISRNATWMRKRRYRALRRIANRVRILRKDSRLFNAHGFTLTMNLIFIMIIFFYAMAVGPLNLFYTTYPEYDLLRNFIPRLGGVLIVASISFITLLYCITLLYRVSLMLFVFRRVTFELTRKTVKHSMRKHRMRKSKKQAESKVAHARTASAEGERQIGESDSGHL